MILTTDSWACGSTLMSAGLSLGGWTASQTGSEIKIDVLNSWVFGTIRSLLSTFAAFFGTGFDVYRQSINGHMDDG
jgi:hypothetical protein